MTATLGDTVCGEESFAAADRASYADTVSGNEHSQSRAELAVDEQVSVLLIADPGKPTALAHRWKRPYRNAYGAVTQSASGRCLCAASPTSPTNKPTFPT